MITREQVDGKMATVSYLDVDWDPCVPADAAVVKVNYDDGGCLILTPQADSEERSLESYIEELEMRYSPDQPRNDHGRFGETGDTTVDKASELDKETLSDAIESITDRVGELEDKGLDQKPEHSALVQIHSALLAAKGDVVSVGLKEGEVVAAASARVTGQNASIMHVGSVQLGAGRAVMEHLVGQLKDRGVSHVTLTATDNAIDKGFYEKLGFQKVAGADYEMDLKS